MKARYSNIFLCIVMLLFAACMGVEESPVPGDYSAPQLTLNDVSQLESSFVIELSATVNYLSDNEGLKDCGFLYSVDPDFQTPNLISLGTKGGISFSATLMLDDFGQKYYFKAYITNGIDEIMSDVKSFIVPDFDTHVHFGGVSVDSYTENTARVSFTANVDNGIKEIERGIELSDNQSFDNARQFVDNQNVNGRGSVLLSELTPGRKYYIRPYVTYKATIVYGEISGLMVYAIPTLKTSQVTLIESDRAVCGATGIDDFGSEIVEKGLVWSKSGNPTVERDSKTVNGSGQADFSAVMTGLEPGTLYYVRAYATNGEGTGYGEQRSFSTAKALPVVRTVQMDNVTANSASVSCSLVSTGGDAIKERGIVWSTHSAPTMGDNKQVDKGTKDTYTLSLNGLEVATQYYVRAYAVNSIGTAYGEELSFTTGKTVPMVSTDQISDISYTTAVCGGDISFDGGTEVTERGVVWGTSQNPVIYAGNSTRDGKGTGRYSSHISGLQPGKTYYVRAYARNEMGIAYGEQRSFTTKSFELPAVETLDITSVTSSSARAGGNVTFNGGTTVTERGIVWSTSHNPTVSLSTRVSNGSGTGEFAGSITGLEFATRYYVRAYATNSVGTAYGAEKSFVTLAVAPSVTTSKVIVEGSTVTLGGIVTATGGADIAERGVVWSKNENPTVSDNKKVLGEGIGNFSTTISGLSPTDMYYVRAYAINDIGISYGDQIKFAMYAKPESITIDKYKVELYEGESVTLKADVSPAGSRQDVIWSSSDESVVAVSADGLVMAKRAGMAIISAEATDNPAVKAQCSVTVKRHVTGVSLSETSVSMFVGKTYSLTATVVPSDATDRSVTWTSSNSSIATVNSTGQITALSKGMATITVTTKDGGYTSRCTVTVKDNMGSVTISPSSLGMLYVGDAATALTAVISPSDYPDKTVSWSSSNTGVATVDTNGKVTPKAPGTAVITVTTNGTDSSGRHLSSSITVNVGRHVTGVSLSKTSLSLLVGETYGLTATVVPSDVTDRSVTWTSSNSSVAAVNSNGQVTAKSQGTATITVKTVDGSKTATCTVTVISLQLPSVSTSSPSAVSISSATVGGNVSSDGGASVTERGVVWSTYSSPTLSDNRKAVGSGTGSFSTTLTDLKASTEYYVRAYAINSVGTAYGSSYSFTTTADGGTEDVGNDDYDWGDIGGNSTHQYVDLGLSVKWATCNVGASKPEEYGDYFAWGETEPYYNGDSQNPTSWKSGKSDGYNWVNTPYQTANTVDWSSTRWTKYLCSTTSSYKDPSATDADALKTVLDPEDDAAHVNWGGSWRMPTRAEQDELRTNCTWTWTTINGIKGYKVQSNKSGYTDRWIFLPAAGCRNGTLLLSVGSYGLYWSSSLYAGSPYRAYYLSFGSGDVDWNYSYRYIGQSVRPVCH